MSRTRNNKSSSIHYEKLSIQWRHWLPLSVHLPYELTILFLMSKVMTEEEMNHTTGETSTLFK